MENFYLIIALVMIYINIYKIYKGTGLLMKKKVLIVNYEPKSLLKLEKLIFGAGFEVFSAKDGVEALESVETHAPDLLIIDPMLPKLSGFEVSKQVSEKYPDLPIIIITSVYKGIKYKNEALTKYGAKDFFEVPFDEVQLLTRVKELLGVEIKKDVSEKKAPVANKKSSKRRLEDILEETISGTMKDLGRMKKKKSKIANNDDGVTFTSEDIFSDVINDVEQSENIPVSKKKKKNFINSDSVNLEVENQLEKTLSGLKIGKKSAKKKEKPKGAPEVKKSAAIVESKIETESEEKKEEVKTEKTSRKKVSTEGIEYGSYVLLEKVATGGMAELFKAKRRGVQGFQKIVAIKRILSHLVDNEDFVTMFIDEAKLAAQLNHPNIAQIYDLGKIDKSFYIAMEYVEGYDLRNIYKECQKKKVFMPEPLVLYVASKILSALDYAHRKKGLDMKDLKIVHRDVSPQNILLSKDGDVKLVDFGIAKAATKASQTQAGALKGKLLYMSPEQAWGKPINHRSDLFSLGSVLYEGLTDKKCFLAESEISILEKVRSVQYDTVTELNPLISDHTEQIVSKSLAKDIDDRYQSAKEMELEIGKMLDALPFPVREKELADFVEALYSGDLSKIKEINDAMTAIKQESKVVNKVPEKKHKPTPAPVPSSAKKGLPVEEVKENKEDKPDTGTVIMPDMEEAEKYEDEMFEKIGSSGSNAWLYISAIVVILVGLIGYFVVYPKMMAKSNVTKDKPVKVSTPIEKVITSAEKTADANVTEVNGKKIDEIGSDVVAKNDEITNEKSKTTSSQSLNTIKKDSTISGTGLENIDQQKLIDELVKKKIAAREAVMKEQIRKDAEKKKLELQKQIDAAKKEKDLLAKKAADEKVAEDKATADAKAKLEEEAKAKAAEQESSNASAKETTTVVSQPESTQVDEPVAPVLKTGDLVPLIEGEVIFPEILKRVEPRKTAAARRLKIRGVIVAQMLIDENGVIKDVRILRNIPGNHGLDKQVRKALKQWKFRPAIKDGIRVSVYFTQTFSF